MTATPGNPLPRPPLLESAAGRHALASASWRTSLAVLRGYGAEVDARDDHLVVRTPANPDYHWGNCLVVTSGDVDDAGGWLGVFEREFPEATHRALGLLRRPDERAWQEAGLAVEVERTFTALSPITPAPVPPGYRVTPVRGLVWDALLRVELAGGPDTAEHRRFATRRLAADRAWVEAGHAEWFAALAPDDSVASSLGIVDVGGEARYQQVGTGASHRRRGLARHLLGAASEWAFARGVRQLVIVADVGQGGELLYDAAGFTPGPVEYGVYAASMARSDKSVPDALEDGVYSAGNTAVGREPGLRAFGDVNNAAAPGQAPGRGA